MQLLFLLNTGLSHIPVTSTEPTKPFKMNVFGLSRNEF